jgi:2-polyprenyl-3-methyl-5-hydroxy-6-metoxy-1,4-benzoquinol methylase
VSRYTAEFGAEGAHGHARDLLARAGLKSGVVLDLGSASGPLAEPIADLGFTYVGADVDRAAVDELASRGFEAHLLDLRGDDDELDAALAAIVGDRPVAAVLLLDVIEHLVDPGPTLRAVARLGSPEHRPLLVVSLPNVSHVDLGAKLLAGRWDLTKIGLLDDTHVRFFNAERMAETLAAAGWRQVDEHDVVNPFSDQQFPADAPVLRASVPLRQFLLRVRTSADPYGETYQFVRSFVQSPAAMEPPAGKPAAGGRSDGPFLSVVVRVSAGGDESAVLRDLSDQTMSDFEVILSHADGADQAATAYEGSQPVRQLKPESDWRNGAIGTAEGRYVAFVDDRTRLAPGYVAELRRITEAMPSRVAQVGAVQIEHPRPGGEVRSYPHLVESATPVDLDPLDLVTAQPFGSVVLAAHAVPREACVTTGVRFPPEPRPGSATLFLLRCIELCGIVRSPEPVTAVEPVAVRAVADDLRYLRDGLGAAPLVIPPGAASSLLQMRDDLTVVVSKRDDLAAQLAAVQDQLGSLQALLLQRQEEIARLAADVDARRSILTRRLRRRLARIARRI